MIALGRWTAYIDEPDMWDWYALPEEMLAEGVDYRPDGTELEALSAAQFAAVRAETIHFAEASVGSLRLPYHNAQHFRLVEEHGMAAVATYERLSGREVPEAVKQHLARALRLHDCGHCGSTFRSEAPRPEQLWRPDLGVAVSAEWVSALVANELGRRQDLTLPGRVFETMVIWASTYGGATPRGRALGIPNPQPKGLWGCLMRASDVCPAPDFADWLRGSIAVNFGEVPAVQAPDDREGFLRAQVGFTDYIQHCFDRLDAASGVELTAELGWRERLAMVRSGLVRAAEGDQEITVLLRTEMARYGVTLR